MKFWCNVQNKLGYKLYKISKTELLAERANISFSPDHNDVKLQVDRLGFKDKI